ncbi:hypothetical protein 7t3_0172 [Salmonella phage 7t3]|nr:hypothetical protein 7t3_0172 [Salmonella phage 7t3]
MTLVCFNTSIIHHQHTKASTFLSTKILQTDYRTLWVSSLSANDYIITKGATEVNPFFLY